jgi:methylase of polypeptide subunit release factors
VGPDERYALVLADPPWVPTTETDRWPEDPRGAIDGGADGLAVAAACLEVAASRLLAGGAILVQLGSRTQAQVLAAQAARLGVSLGEVRSGERGVVARFAGTLDEPPDRAPG